MFEKLRAMFRRDTPKTATVTAMKVGAGSIPAYNPNASTDELLREIQETLSLILRFHVTAHGMVPLKHNDAHRAYVEKNLAYLRGAQGGGEG